MHLRQGVDRPSICSHCGWKGLVIERRCLTICDLRNLFDSFLEFSLIHLNDMDSMYLDAPFFCDGGNLEQFLRMTCFTASLPQCTQRTYRIWTNSFQQSQIQSTNHSRGYVDPCRIQKKCAFDFSPESHPLQSLAQSQHCSTTP